MTNILDNANVNEDVPKLIVRKAPHAPVWSVWALLEGTPSVEVFEGSSEEEASSWINTGGQAWLEESQAKAQCVALSGSTEQGDVVLERLGKVCGWVGTGLALLIVVWGFLTWHAGNGGPLYFGVLAAVSIFLIGQALRYVLAGKPSDRHF